MILVGMDYKDLEGAMAAYIAKDTTYINDYMNGVDHHQKLADQLNITRAQAKVLNHSVRYGRSAYTIALDLGITQDAAQAMIDGYWKHHPEICSHRKAFIKLARTNKQFGTVFSGQLVQVQQGMKDDQIYATYIQGSGADVVKFAMLRTDAYLKEHKAGRIMLNMHDQLVFALVDETHINPLKEIMENAAQQYPLKVEVSVGGF